MLPIKINLPEHFLEEEVRNDYTVSSEMKKVWAVELDLLAELTRVCKEHDIEFWGAGGTMLGAARHSGFIPWDDDIDLMMTRENFNKLCSCAPTAFSEPYFFQTDETDPGSLRGHAQLRNSKTTGVLKSEYCEQLPFNQGIFIDIFPLDQLPDDLQEREKFLKELRKCWIAMHRLAAWTGYAPRKSKKPFLAAIQRGVVPIGRLLERTFHLNRLLERKFEKLSRKYNRQHMKQVGLMPLPLTTDRFILNRADVESGTVYLDYEFLKLPVPVHYERLLDSQYGNWRHFVRNGSLHGGTLFEPEIPYKEYLAKKKGE